MRLSLLLLLGFWACFAQAKADSDIPSIQQRPSNEHFWTFHFEQSSIDITTPTEEGASPKPVVLTDVFPNPFWPVLSIHFEVFEAGDIDFIVTDLAGLNVGQASLKEASKGSYHSITEKMGLKSGFYIYRIKHNGVEIDTTRTVILK